MSQYLSLVERQPGMRLSSLDEFFITTKKSQITTIKRKITCKYT